MSQDTQKPTFVSEGLQILKPSWTIVQSAVCSASGAAEDAQGAWVRYQDAKARLQNSRLARKVETLQAEWQEANKIKQDREAHRDNVLREALGVKENEVAA